MPVTRKPTDAAPALKLRQACDLCHGMKIRCPGGECARERRGQPISLSEMTIQAYDINLFSHNLKESHAISAVNCE